MKNISSEVAGHLLHICEQLKRNRAAVLVGSGFSRNADKVNISASSFPTWDGLAKVFADKLNESDIRQLQFQNPLALAEQVEATYGRPTLDSIIINSIPDKQYRPSVLHEKLLSLPWNDVFTTNYDTLLERASQNISIKRFNIVTCQDDLVGSADAPRIVKLHGTIPSHRPFIATQEDYRRYPKDFAPFVNTVQQSLLENTLCLLGFSGDDPNFEQWIGWIRDNLGSDNSPIIYLFAHEKTSEVKKRILLKKNIIVLDISCLSENNCLVSEYYEALLDYLLENTKDNSTHWYNIPSHDRSNADTRYYVETLKSIRENYPGWLIVPHSEREHFSWFLRKINSQMLKISQQDKEEWELSLLYEYDWLRIKLLRPILPDELVSYNVILTRNAGSDIYKEVAIYLSIMRDYRESGELNEWKKIDEKVLSELPSEEMELRHQLIYEQCLFSMFTFDFNGVNRRLNEWKVDRYSPVWALRKAGLLAECNKLSEAQSLLKETLTSIRQQLQSSAQNIFLLSLESAIMSLQWYVEDVMSSSGKDNNYIDRRALHGKYNADWNRENELFELPLEAPPKTYSTTEVEPSFDFGRQTITSRFGEDVELFRAYAYLKFREETGHPFRIRNHTYGDKSAAGAARRIARYSFMWAIVTLVRANEKKALSSIEDRAFLSELSVSDVDELCNVYINALRSAEHEMSSADWFDPNSYAMFSSDILPAALSRLCCKCSGAMRDRILDLLLTIYNSEKRQCYKNVSELVRRLIESYTDGEINERIHILLRFPYIDEETRHSRELPDPFRYIDFPKDKLIPCDIEYEETNSTLLKAENGNPCERVGACYRLTILSYRGLLNNAQEKLFAEILWKTKPSSRWLLRTVYLELPHPDGIDPNILVSDIISDFLSFDENRQEGFRSSESLFMELRNLAQIANLPIDEISSLILKCLELAKLIAGNISIGRNTELMNYSSSVLARLNVLTETVVYFLLHYNDIEPNLIKEDMEEYLSFLQAKEINCPALEITWNSKLGMPANSETLLPLLTSGDGNQRLAALKAVALSVNNENFAACMTNSLKSEALELVSQQIKWRRVEHLVSAVNIFANAVTANDPVVSEKMKCQVIQGLSQIYTETVISRYDTPAQSSDKGSLRMAAAHLAGVLHKSYSERQDFVPVELLLWESVKDDPNEFIEVRNAYII